jgi:flagellar export protein FliJ
MSGFRFSLEKALDLRRLQLQLAEARFQQQAAALLELDLNRREMRTSRTDAEAQVRDGRQSQGRDLTALGTFRVRVQGEEKDLAQRYAEGERKLEDRRAAMLEARRRCRLLERLKERRSSEWNAARGREIEELAAESFLAQWNRGQA